MRISKGDDTSPVGNDHISCGDLLASPNFGICDTTPGRANSVVGMAGINFLPEELA
jgi:hypothetical protein